MAHHSKAKNKNKLSVKDVLRLRKKESKKKLKEKRARLVVKNLPFGSTEENLKEYFSKYGDITDLKLLKKEDDKLLGCAFVQFKLVQKARKAKHHTNGQPFLGRNLEVDFAMPKNKYEKIKVKTEIKQEGDKTTVKEEPIDVDEVQKEQNSNENDEEKSDNDSISEGDLNENCTDQDTDEEIGDKEKVESRPKVFSNDISEGKTIFIKNVPFTATNDDLKECMSQFGPLYYALICVDKSTEHSKGTAFVKFCFKEDAEKALQAGTELVLMDNVLDCHKALDKTQIQNKHEQKKDQGTPTDSRNLYLVKEGVIMAGSKAAEGVSASDMAKRLQLEQYKSQILRNLNMFVSRVRVVIHNIPLNWDDKKLRTLCAKFIDKKAKIKEAKVMRDLKNVDSKGVGQSKGFGFVTLDTHESALNLLRNLNNNPNIFSKSKRPIVSFSIEKRSAVRSKQNRLERSKLKNPKSKFFNPSLKDEKPTRTETNVTEEDMKEYSGIPAVPGVQRMRSNFKLSAQAKKHFDNVKKEKRKKKLGPQTLAEKKKSFTKQERQKIGKAKDNDFDFSKLVSNYKKTIVNAPALKTKWYT